MRKQDVLEETEHLRWLRPGAACGFLFTLGWVVATSIAWSQTPLDVNGDVPSGEVPAIESRPVDAKEREKVHGVIEKANSKPYQVGAAGDMIGFSNYDDTGTQTITLIDTRKSWMAVYHIDRSGTIRLVSSRPIDADFTLQLNATAPLPEDIRQIGKGNR